MYDNRSNLIIGFHGCDKTAAAALINNPDTIKFSKQPYDWLGHGMYFWENNQERAHQWAVDCTVIEFMHSHIEEQHKRNKQEKGFSELRIFDSTRGVFTEGGPICEGAEIFEKTHIQICIRNSNCIKGFFLPRREIEFLPAA
jgi:hypothetical protein